MFYLSIVLAGGGGALSRYLLGHVTVNLGWGGLPFGTLIANVVGCFLMGYLSWVMVHRWQLSQEAQVIVLTGFLGGFTTFSAFSLETMRLLEDGSSLRALLYVFVSVALSLLMCFLGLFWARQS